MVLTALGAITLSQRDAEEYKKSSAFYNGPEPRPSEPGAKPNAKQLPNKKASQGVSTAFLNVLRLLSFFDEDLQL